MINISDKKKCNGCDACHDICPVNAIEMVTDKEGFWYPEVDYNICIKCGKCIDVCPEINFEKIINKDSIKPECFVANNKDIETRKDSTSGGIFSAFADVIFEQKGAIAGAIYNRDFSVRHIVSSNKKDLSKIRSSKYLQSDCRDFYKKIKIPLLEGKRVLACGTPCQMAALRLFLGKNYENLIICDFICKGINSPKVFRKHLDSLEERYDSKVVYVKAKNKELGWRNLTFKAMFENGKTYYGTRNEDDFTRGYLDTAYYCRPSCYECNFKNTPRLADITIGDFWGVENVAPSLDDNLGTSLIMCNTSKGFDFFKTTENKLDFRQVSIDKIASGNHHMFKSVQTNINKRVNFFSELDNMNFSKLSKKYFPKPKKKKTTMLKKSTKKILILLNTMRYSPKAILQFIWLNFLRKNTNSNIFKMNVIVPTPYCVFDLHPSSKINVQGFVTIGFSKIRGSHLETRIRLDSGSEVTFNDRFTFYAGADVQVFPNAKLVCDGGDTSGCNINCQIICGDSITIGKKTIIGRNVVIRDYDAHYVLNDKYRVKAPITIGDHCWIGENALISKGVKIGNGSIVAARSWVIKKVKAKTLVGGTPAIVLERNIEWKL